MSAGGSHEPGSISFASSIASQRASSLSVFACRFFPLSARACAGSASRTSTPRVCSSHATQRQPQVASIATPASLPSDSAAQAASASRVAGKTSLHHLAARRVEHDRLEDVLVDIDRCVQHSHWGLLRSNATTVDRPSEAPFDEIRFR